MVDLRNRYSSQKGKDRSFISMAHLGPVALVPEFWQWLLLRSTVVVVVASIHLHAINGYLTAGRHRYNERPRTNDQV